MLSVGSRSTLAHSSSELNPSDLALPRGAMKVVALLCVVGAVAHIPATLDHSNATPEYSNAWAKVRGVNYVPSYSSNPVQTWMDYDPATIERELGFAQSIKLNTVRVFLHMFAWKHNRIRFLSNYDHFVAACAERDIKPLVVVFDDDFYDAGLPNVTDWEDPAEDQKDTYLYLACLNVGYLSKFPKLFFNLSLCSHSGG